MASKNKFLNTLSIVAFRRVNKAAAAIPLAAAAFI